MDMALLKYVANFFHLRAGDDWVAHNIQPTGLQVPPPPRAVGRQDGHRTQRLKKPGRRRQTDFVVVTRGRSLDTSGTTAQSASFADNLLSGKSPHAGFHSVTNCSSRNKPPEVDLPGM